MSRLSYPLNGLKNSFYDNLEQAKSHLTTASLISVYGPDSYSKSSFVGELPTKIKNYQRKLTNIMNAVIDVTNVYTELEEDLNIIDKNITSPTLKARERLIK